MYSLIVRTMKLPFCYSSQFAASLIQVTTKHYLHFERKRNYSNYVKCFIVLWDTLYLTHTTFREFGNSCIQMIGFCIIALLLLLLSTLLTSQHFIAGSQESKVSLTKHFLLNVLSKTFLTIRHFWIRTYRAAGRLSTFKFSCNLRSEDLLGYYAASNDNPLPTFRDKASVPFSRVKKSMKKRDRHVAPETSVKHSHSTLRNSPEERRSHQYRGGSLKSHFV